MGKKKEPIPMGTTVDGVDHNVIEVEKPFSEAITEFANETMAKSDDELKVENLPIDQQVEFAAKFFQMYNPIFANKIDKMQKKAMARVIKRLMAYPLETPKDMTWNSKEEKDAFLIGDRLLETKYAMFKYVVNEELQKANELKKEEKKEDGKV